HCGATLTAILYAELWCEAHFGRPTLGEPSFDEDSDAVEPHEALLMGCYSAVNELDAIYAVARTNKLPSRLAIDRHEGRWEKVLETLDHAMSHRPAPAGAALSSGATPAVPSLQSQSQWQGQWAQQGVVAALQHMACSHVLQAYCRGAVSAPSAAVATDAAAGGAGAVAGAAVGTAGAAGGAVHGALGTERTDFLELQ
ncbi:unnamed protein product, partial [Closterium sp. Naga37s-1]